MTRLMCGGVVKATGSYYGDFKKSTRYFFNSFAPRSDNIQGNKTVMRRRARRYFCCWVESANKYIFLNCEEKENQYFNCLTCVKSRSHSC